MFKRMIFAFVFIVFLFVPLQVFAVDYNIDDVEIDAFLQSDGNVSVQERHTYSFDGEFGGIIRELVPKEGTDIVYVEAFERGTSLEIEVNDHEYRIHRAGEDETIVVDLFYEIHQGVAVHKDVGEFYWPFFDRRNSSTYDNLTINVFPPETTSNVIVLGYDEAFEKEVLLEDGHVQFQYGRVPSNTNGDIRVAYDAELFGEASVTSNNVVGPKIEEDKEQILAAAAARQERREAFSAIGFVIVPLFTLMLLVIALWTWMQAKGKRNAILREIGDRKGLLPKQVLSLPATIYYTHFQRLTPEMVGAALLDLVRKGHVKKLDDYRFQLVNREGLHRHEQRLVRWLFDEIGTDDIFSFEELEEYTKKKKNQTIYQEYYSQWHNEIRKEVREADLYENKTALRVTMVLIGIMFMLLSFLFIASGLFSLFSWSLMLFIAYLIFGIGYRPKTYEGAKISYEWSLFKKEVSHMKDKDWVRLSEDDKMRTFIYRLGINDKSLQEQSEATTKSFQQPVNNQFGQPSTAYGFDPTWFVIGGVATSSFQSAQKDTTPSTTSDSGSTFTGGGGIGGGGGGSGAF
ncbi:DUF2207 domain-containing protein [Evansella sp. AB-P1]|uniref:DUF2207 domain-containing protein n=1 Tax=Evansella sp. AB-P1 TaxID=3037653 RepID=UPI00241CAA3A|nr:DUF2207 domain-containing protein [Evansella sp. AB-P1]MDG5788522.1 DUF2207 domain-containing protein [Evansella sp. AB-P1]